MEDCLSLTYKLFTNYYCGEIRRLDEKNKLRDWFHNHEYVRGID